VPAATETEAIERGPGTAAAVGALEPAAGTELGAAAVAEAGADPHAVLLPNASPATTHGVVSELIWILLPGGCVMEMVALEDEETAAGVVYGAAEGAVAAAVELVLLLAVELTADGVVEGAAPGVVALEAGLGDAEAEEPAGLAGEVELAEGAEAAAGGTSPEKAVATSDEDK
jgi:hypothetical protein